MLNFDNLVIELKLQGWKPFGSLKKSLPSYKQGKRIDKYLQMFKDVLLVDSATLADEPQPGVKYVFVMDYSDKLPESLPDFVPLGSFCIDHYDPIFKKSQLSERIEELLTHLEDVLVKDDYAMNPMGLVQKEPSKTIYVR